MIYTQRRTNVDAHQRRCIDVDALLSQLCVPAGSIAPQNYHTSGVLPERNYFSFVRYKVKEEALFRLGFGTTIALPSKHTTS